MICKVCGVKAQSDLCFRHKPRKGFKTSSFLQTKLKKAGIDLMRNFFLEIWRNRAHVSEVSPTFLGNEPLSVFFHHILSKGKYPQAMYDKENIILMTLDEHSNVESNMYKYEEVNKRREKLHIKYKIDM